ncbi:NUDIX hydrolase [Streptomyces sp. NPDC049879]|uniref:NUDIX hydrolase n=1 Tax=Streptomyces sp. NPDC049879 TaxID=3365598 RepID=UPI0037A0F7F7
MPPVTDAPGDPGPIRAAGCVLWRKAAGGGIEVALVHRPKYDDWSHPKGKLDNGEPHAAAAVREVREETGMDCVLGRPLPTARYLTEGGRSKVVRYWTAEAVRGRFEPNDEVDAVVWLAPPEARVRLTGEPDRTLLDEALVTLLPVR